MDSSSCSESASQASAVVQSSLQTFGSMARTSTGRGVPLFCVTALCLATGSHMAQAGSAHGRKILQATAAPGGACGAGVARCGVGPTGRPQCCSQYGYCGETSAHCNTKCQPLYSASGSTCASRSTPPPVAPPPVTPPPGTPTPPAPVAPAPASGCVDTFAACPGWANSCSVPGVASQCPCMCGGGSAAPPPTTPPPTVQPPPPTQPPAQPPVVPQPPTPPVGAVQSSIGVSYHLYDSVNFPAVPEAGVPAYSLTGTNPGYGIDGLYCTDYMRANPGIPWSTVGWTATNGIASGTLRCGDRICIRNRRNGAQTTAYVVDQGGKGSPTAFDVDYNRVFRVLDADNQNYLRGNVDIDWWKC